MAAKARKSASKTTAKKPAAKTMAAPKAPVKAKAKPAAKVPRPLTPRQQRFVEEYLVDLNATQAAIRAGYSEKTAEQQGYQLLQIPSVRAAVDAKRAEVSEKTAVTVERVLLEAARLAFFDARKLFDKDGNPKKLTELDDETAAAIQGLDVATIGNMEVGFGQVLKYKIADKNSAIERLFKHLGMFERDNKQSNPGDALASLLGKISASGSRLPVAPRGSKA